MRLGGVRFQWRASVLGDDDRQASRAQPLARAVKGFVGLGGNFVRAVPETGLVEAVWAGLQLTVQIATKLNRSHLIHGKVAYLLPCRGRIEIDTQATGRQSVTMKDSTWIAQLFVLDVRQNEGH